jgi:hypothetical protein
MWRTATRVVAVNYNIKCIFCLQKLFYTDALLTKLITEENFFFSTMTFYHFVIKGTVQQKLTWVKSGINRKLMIWAWAAWGLVYILRGLGP